MKKALPAGSLILFALGLVLWIATGANRGWTKTSVPIKKVDEVTGIEGIEYQKRFVPGLDFLGAAWLGSGILGGVSLFIRKKPSTK
jgi:hypothetical protein